MWLCGVCVKPEFCIHIIGYTNIQTKLLRSLLIHGNWVALRCRVALQIEGGNGQLACQCFGVALLFAGQFEYEVVAGHNFIFELSCGGALLRSTSACGLFVFDLWSDFVYGCHHDWSLRSALNKLHHSHSPATEINVDRVGWAIWAMGQFEPLMGLFGPVWNQPKLT